MKSILASASLLLLVAGATSATAGNWPNSVVGRYAVTGNTHTNITLSISAQGGTGQCKLIKGSLIDPDTGADDNIEGIYCPNSGRIAFLRHIGDNAGVFQSWIGNLSQTQTPQFMGGTFYDILNVRGEYEWFGTSSPTG